MGNYVRQHPVAIALSVLLHGLVAAALIVSVDLEVRAPHPAAELAIQATVVDQKTLQRMQQRAESEQAQARKARQEKARAAQAAARKAREEKQRKEQQLEQLRAKREKAARLAQQKREREAAEKKKQAAAEAARKAAEKRAAEQRRLAEEKRKRKQAEEAKRKAAAARQQKALDAQLAADLAAEEKRRKAEQSGLLDRYVRLIQNQIEQQWIKPPSAHPGLTCVVDVQQIPDGTVVSVHVRADKCNGDAAVRRSIETAVLKASPLPKPPVPELFERNLVITFRPDQVG